MSYFYQPTLFSFKEFGALPIIIKMRLENGPDAECTTSICRCTELGVPICDEGSNTKEWRRLYRKRTTCERVNGRLKQHLLLDRQHVRGKAKVTVNVMMSLLVMLSSAIAMAELDKLENVRRIVALAA